MRILLLNSVYREGSTGKIVASIGDVLRSQGHEVLTCYGLGEHHIDVFSKRVCTDLEHYFNAIWSRISGIPYGGLFFSNWRIKQIIRQFQPDVVHVHCVNASTMNVYSLLKYLAKKGIKTVLTLHAEIFHTAGCSHAYECTKWIDGCHDCEFYKQRVFSWFFDRSETSYRKMYEAVNAFRKDKLAVTAVSPWLADRAKRSSIMKHYDVLYVPNGVDTSVFYYKKNKGLIERGQFKKVILFVTPYFGMEETDVKGGRYLADIAFQLSNFLFVVVATTVSKSLPKLPVNVCLWGRAKSQGELVQLYSEADVTLLLSQRETFSMVTAESLCCGTPIIGFIAGGPESIALKDYSKFVEYGNILKLIDALDTGFSPKIKKKDIALISSRAYSSEYCANLFLKIYFN